MENSEMEEEDLKEINLMINNFFSYGEGINAKSTNAISACVTILSTQLALCANNEEQIDEFLELMKAEIIKKKKKADILFGEKDEFYLI